jgi:FemAB-related protein (PEP-CTERM system-associated)
MEIRQLADAATAARWDAFVHAEPDATFFHLSGWRDVISSTFGHRCHFLYAEEGGAIRGVLPLAQVRSALFGHKLVSLPFCVYGGVAACDQAARLALVGRASALARELGADYLELRHIRHSVGLPVGGRYVTFRRALDPDPEKNLAAIPRKQRAMIRKGAAKGLAPEFGVTVRQFFDIYAESLRSLGTPVLPQRFFAALQRVFGEQCGVMAVRAGTGGPLVAAVMSFYFRDQVLPYYGGGTALAREYHAYDFMYWELLADALSRGCRVFDFGRSRRDSGSFRFKTHWGFEPEPLEYEYDMAGGGSLPNFTPDNPRYARLIGIWRRLPLPVTKVVGPWLARDLG